MRQDLLLIGAANHAGTREDLLPVSFSHAGPDLSSICLETNPDLQYGCVGLWSAIPLAEN